MPGTVPNTYQYVPCTQHHTQHLNLYAGVPVSLVGGDCAPSDVMLVLDSSESVHEDDWQRFKKFTHEVVNALPISKDEMHVGIVEFATDVRSHAHRRACSHGCGLTVGMCLLVATVLQESSCLRYIHMR